MRASVWFFARCCLCLGAISPACTDAAERGDILVTEFGYFSSSNIGHYQADGTYVGSITGTGMGWRGADTLPNGLVLTTVEEPKEVRIFGYGSFPIDEIISPGDVDVFSDGTIAVADQLNSAIELYSPLGEHIRSISSAGQTSTFGLFIDRWDHLWATDLYPNGELHSGSSIFEYDQYGSLIRELDLAWNASDLVVDRRGELWVANWWEQDVMHLSSNGQLLDSFPVPTTMNYEANHFGSIALDLDGNILAIVRTDPVIYRISSSGVLLETIPRIATAEECVFMTVVGYVPEPSDCAITSIAVMALLAWNRSRSSVWLIADFRRFY